MSLIRKPIKISIAADQLGVSADAIRRRQAGTAALTLFRRKGCNRLYVWDTEVQRLLKENIIVVYKGEYD